MSIYRRSRAVSNPPKGFTFSASINSTLNSTDTIDLVTWGPQLMGSKMLLDKKMILSASAGLNQTSTNGNFLTRNINLRSSCRYRPSEMHNLTLDIAWLQRHRANNGAVTNFSISLSYALTLKKYKLFSPIRPASTDNNSNHPSNN